MQNAPHSSRFPMWFDPRKRHPGTWAFILNRITALGLSLYLILHLFMLGKLAQGPEAYDTFIALAKTPVVKAGELLVVAAGLIHGLNGIRIALNSFGIGVTRQKQIFWILMALAATGTAFFAYKMFLGE
jgi:succinate dehydrogenase / fumarate reductase cytochrome b subunit